MTVPKIYVASSFRNQQHPLAVKALRRYGFEVYDFRDPAPGEGGRLWPKIDPEWEGWDRERFRAALADPRAVKALSYHTTALHAADALVLVMPCGRSSHLEAGFVLGRNKPVVAWLTEACEPDLSYGMLHSVETSLPGVIEALSGHLGFSGAA